LSTYKLPLLRQRSMTTGVSSGAETVYPSGAPEFTPNFSGVRAAQCFSFLGTVL